MRKFLIATVILTILSIPIVSHANSCKTFKEYFTETVVQKRQPLLFTAVAYPGYVIAWHMDRSGNWSMWGVTDGAKEVCHLMSGENFSQPRWRIASN